MEETPHVDTTSAPADPAMAVAGPSQVDAMGKDKRRQVVGHSYGPSRRQQLVFFGIVAAVIAVIWLGSKVLIANFDQPPATNPDAAPWSKGNAPQTPPPPPF